MMLYDNCIICGSPLRGKGNSEQCRDCAEHYGTFDVARVTAFIDEIEGCGPHVCDVCEVLATPNEIRTVKNNDTEINLCGICHSRWIPDAP